MSLRETTISKLQQLPESLLLEVDRFIDFLLQRNTTQTTDDNPTQPDTNRDYEAAWEQWFEEVDRLAVQPDDGKPRIKPSRQEFVDILVEKYRKQGLDL